MNKEEQILDELEKELSLIDDNLVNWNVNYFRFHRSRYLSDLKIFLKYYKEGEVLEIGSAPCHFSFCLAKLNYPFCGLDVDPERLSSFIQKNGLNIKKCNIEKEPIPFEDNTFHFIFFNEVFEHMRIDPISTLKEIRRVLHPDGVLMLSTPNLYSLHNILKFMLGRGFDNPYKEFNKIHELGHMGHVREYSAKQVAEFLENTGYSLQEANFKSYRKYKGIKIPFNLVRFLFPNVNTHQVTISRKK